jgi:hypothetical protein
MQERNQRQWSCISSIQNVLASVYGTCSQALAQAQAQAQATTKIYI